MKWILFVLLISVTSISSCIHHVDEKAPSRDSQNISTYLDVNPNKIFKENCSMCHGLYKDLTAHAMVKYSVKKILNYYDGKSITDSTWKQHKKIQLSRNEWESVAYQVQPGDVFPYQH